LIQYLKKLSKELKAKEWDEEDEKMASVSKDNKGEENLYTDRDMCSFCFAEIYLNGPAHVCPKKSSG
jgi:hypothetical protein